MHHEWIDPPFYDMIDNHPLLDLYVQNAMEVGRHPSRRRRVRWSLDPPTWEMSATRSLRFIP